MQLKKRLIFFFFAFSLPLLVSMLLLLPLFLLNSHWSVTNAFITVASIIVNCSFALIPFLSVTFRSLRKSLVLHADQQAAGLLRRDETDVRKHIWAEDSKGPSFPLIPSSLHSLSPASSLCHFSAFAMYVYDLRTLCVYLSDRELIEVIGGAHAESRDTGKKKNPTALSHLSAQHSAKKTTSPLFLIKEYQHTNQLSDAHA